MVVLDIIMFIFVFIVGLAVVLLAINSFIKTIYGDKSYFKDMGCYFGYHDWYRGSFSAPVWGRQERHCKQCNRKEYLDHKKKKYIKFK